MGFISDLLKRKAVPAEQAAKSEAVFEKIKAARGTETGRWLNLMVDPSKIPPPNEPSTLEDLDQRDQTDTGIYSPPMQAMQAELEVQLTTPELWVGGLFDEFARLAQEYNRGVAAEELKVSIKRPALDAERRFLGSIATAHWGLLVQGLPEAFHAFIAPGDDVLSWSAEDLIANNVTPFLTVNAVTVGERRCWYLGEEQVHAECSPRLAKALFGDLIRVASGQMSESELFSDEEELVLGRTIARAET